MQIEIAIDNKKHIIRELHEKITEGIEKEMQLTKAQLYEQKAAKDAEHMRTWKSTECARLHKKYGHLWKFW